jgi:hypothetical protein
LATAILAFSSQSFADDAPLPELLNGTFVPQLSLRVTSDTGTDKTQISNASREVQCDGTTNNVAKVDDGWPSNGSGAARAAMSVICSKVKFQRDVGLELIIRTDVFAQSGCCGGKQPGGEAWASFGWFSHIDLPKQERPWKVSFDVDTQTTTTGAIGGRILPLPKCTVQIGEMQQGLDPNLAHSKQLFDLPPGIHAVHLMCPPMYGLNYRGAGKIDQSTATVIMDINISVGS